jgi:hypothetical protein
MEKGETQAGDERSVGAGAGNLRGGFSDCRNSDDEECAAFGLVLAGDESVVIADNPIDSAKTEAGAFADGLGGVEGIENAQGIANAGPGI